MRPDQDPSGVSEPMVADLAPHAPASLVKVDARVFAASRRFSEAVQRWDDHLDRCGSCLGQGVWYCSEGEWLTATAHESRQRYFRLLRGVAIAATAKRSALRSRSSDVGPQLVTRPFRVEPTA